MASTRLEELQKKLQNTEERGGEPLTDEELEELEGGEDQTCLPNSVCKPDTGNSSCSGNP